MDEPRRDPPSDEPIEPVGDLAEPDTSAPPGGGGDVLERLIESDAAPEELAPRIEEQDAPDAADTLERLEPEESAEVLARMSDESASEALSQMIPELAATVLFDAGVEEAARYIGPMAPDDAADVLQELPPGFANEVVIAMHPKRAAEIGKVSRFDPKTAGGMMTTDITVVRAERTIGQAIDTIKRHKITETQPDIYCVDEDRRLVGTIRLRDLLIQDDDDSVAAWMHEETHSIEPDLDQEEVARGFERYDLVTAPVVDDQRRILGMVTIDDVVDIITEEVTEDALKQVGAGADEAVYSSLRTKVRGRLPWLLINLPLAGFGAGVIVAFEGMIKEFAIIAALYPIIANQTGNAGHQSMAVTLRGIVLDDIRPGRVAPLLVKELFFGVLVGVVAGTLFALALAFFGWIGVSADLTIRIGLVAGMSMAIALSVGCIIGTSMPLLMRRMGFDPATASSILVTMLTDAISYFTFLGLVFLFRAWLLA